MAAPPPSNNEGMGVRGGGIIGAGAGGGFGLNAVGKGPAVQHFSGSKGGKGVGVPEELEQIWEDIIGDASPTSWVLLEYSEDGKALVVKGTGEGGITEFRACLGEGLSWGAFRCTAVDNRENTTSRRAKFVFVQYMPPSAPAMRRAKMGSHKGQVKEVIRGAHVDIMIDDPSELEENDLVSRLQAATGAHKPNGYEFDPGVLTSAEGFLNG